MNTVLAFVVGIAVGLVVAAILARRSTERTDSSRCVRLIRDATSNPAVMIFAGVFLQAMQQASAEFRQSQQGEPDGKTPEDNALRAAVSALAHGIWESQPKGRLQLNCDQVTDVLLTVAGQYPNIHQSLPREEVRGWFVERANFLNYQLPEHIGFVVKVPIDLIRDNAR